MYIHIRIRVAKRAHLASTAPPFAECAYIYIYIYHMYVCIYICAPLCRMQGRAGGTGVADHESELSQ